MEERILERVVVWRCPHCKQPVQLPSQVQFEAQVKPKTESSVPRQRRKYHVWKMDEESRLRTMTANTQNGSFPQTRKQIADALGVTIKQLKTKMAKMKEKGEL